MNRFHVHLGVPDLPTSIRFYTGLFGVEPTVSKDDYAKWSERKHDVVERVLNCRGKIACYK